MLQHRYYSYQRAFLVHEHGIWLKKGCMKRFFVTAVVRATIQNKVALSLRMDPRQIIVRLL